MSKYTTEVRFICESKANIPEEIGGIRINDVIEESWKKIFDFDFPIFNEEYRPTLCKKILKHYYFREIGEETYGLWKARLDMRLNEIMPYYNKLYETELLKFDPLVDTELTRHNTLDSKGKEDNKRTSNTENTSELKNDNTINNTRNATNENWDLFSDTPQGGINGINAVDSQMYLTTAKKNTDSNKITDKNTSSQELNSKDKTKNTDETKIDKTNNHTFDEIIKGKTGGKSYATMIQEYRDILLNIDLMVIAELKDLFINLW